MTLAEQIKLALRTYQDEDGRHPFCTVIEADGDVLFTYAEDATDYVVTPAVPT